MFVMICVQSRELRQKYVTVPNGRRSIRDDEVVVIPIIDDISPRDKIDTF